MIHLIAPDGDKTHCGELEDSVQWVISLNLATCQDCKGKLSEKLGDLEFNLGSLEYNLSYLDLTEEEKATTMDKISKIRADIAELVG